MPRLRILSRSDVARLVSMSEAIKLMREGFSHLSKGTVDVPIRMNMGMPEHDARALFMPIYSASHGQIAQKVVTIHPNNGQYDLPFIHAMVFLIDAVKGTPLALMDGEFITALRTGAGSGLATDLLSRPESSTLAIYGAGVQARTQLEAICAVRPITKVMIFGRNPENVSLFAEEITANYEVEVVAPSDPEEVSNADIICTATTSIDPVFSDSHISEGCHINGVGSYRPDMTEIPAETVSRASVFVDQRAASLEEAGDLIVPISRNLITEQHIVGEIGEVVNGNCRGRTSDQEATFFKSVGNAVQDLVVASYAYKLAKKQGMGTTASL